MKFASPFARAAAVVAGVFVSTSALAVPGFTTESATEDDAVVTLTVQNQTIVPDAVSPCTVSVNVDDEDLSWTNGDTVRVWVYEDDTVGDETIWDSGEITINVGNDISGGRFIREWDCSGDFEEDGFGSSLEIYARIEVEKDDCGFFDVCTNDRVNTDNIDSEEVEDDGREENDSAAAAGASIAAGRTNNLIARDNDFLGITTTSVSRLQIDVLHRPASGRLDAALFTAAGASVPATVTDQGDRTRLVADIVGVGSYAVRINPEVQNNPNFYDVDYSRTDVATECTPGATENVACGNCGGAERACGPLGTWQEPAECLNEGECAQGATETEPCDGGAEHTRTCGGDCTWGEFEECVGGSCEPGETSDCYTGDPETEGVGACVGGERTCVNGTFSECEGEVTPLVEICGNGLDDDCDGRDDLRDEDCDTGLARLGEPCDDDGDCDERWTCLGDPDPDRFIDGYCGDDSTCSGADMECTADGVCADLGDSDYCLLACGDGIGCRFGYTCASLPEGDACIPRCRDDNDCFFDDAPECNAASGLCTAVGGGDPNDTDDTAVTADIKGCGCSSSALPAAGWIGGFGLLFLVGRRRR